MNIFIFLNLIFYYFTLHILSPIHPPTLPHPIPPPYPTPYPHGCPHLHPTWHLNSLGPPVFWGLVSSSLNEHRPGSPQLYVCWGLISAGVCCLFGGPVFQRSQGSRLRLLVLRRDHLPPQLLSAFPNSTTGVSCFCPLVECKYLHLTFPAACWVFRSAAMLGLFLWALR